MICMYKIPIACARSLGHTSCFSLHPIQRSWLEINPVTNKPVHCGQYIVIQILNVSGQHMSSAKCAKAPSCWNHIRQRLTAEISFIPPGNTVWRKNCDSLRTEINCDDLLGKYLQPSYHQNRTVANMVPANHHNWSQSAYWQQYVVGQI